MRKEKKRRKGKFTAKIINDSICHIPRC